MGADYNGPNVGPLNSYQSSLSEFGDENLSTLEDIAGKATWLVCMALDADFNHLKRIQQMTKRPVVVGQMPKLRTLPIDQLMHVDDDFLELDHLIRSHIQKIIKFNSKICSSIKKVVNSYMLPSYKVNSTIANFKWDCGVFNPITPLKDLYEKIINDVQRIGSEMEILQQRYDENINEFRAYESQDTCSLADKKPHLVISDSQILSTQYLTTLYVTLPKILKDDFIAIFDNEEFNVVPRSLNLIDADRTHLAYTIVVFKKQAQDYIKYLSDKKINAQLIEYGKESAKDYWYDRAENKERVHTTANVAKIWLEMTVEEIISLYLHIKIIILHNQYILKFGLPLRISHFLTIFLSPNCSKTSLHKTLVSIGNEIIAKDKSLSQSVADMKTFTTKHSIHADDHEVPFSLQKFGNF